MRTDILKLGLVGASILALAACGSTRTASTADTIPVTTTTTSSTTSSATGYGTVQAIDLVPRQQAGIGLGTVAGAVVGGVLGNQVGGGSGRTAATVAGAAGGALAGHELEKGGQQTDQVYRVTVRMDNGALQTLVQESTGGLQVGERVRVSNGVIVERVVR
jgi:outer membrane lipoprotein SlyB